MPEPGDPLPSYVFHGRAVQFARRNANNADTDSKLGITPTTSSTSTKASVGCTQSQIPY